MCDAIQETSVAQDHGALLRSNGASGIPDSCSHLNTQLFLLSSLGCEGNAVVVKPCGAMENSGSEFRKHIFICILFF